MDYSNMDELVNRYWAGELTNAEEGKLKDYFRYSKVPEHLADTAAYFRAMEQEKTEKVLDDSFDQELMAAIQPERPVRRLRNFNFSRIAAAVIVLFGVTFALYYMTGAADTSTPNVIVDTYDDPEEAYEQVKGALMMMSTNMNFGMDYSQKLTKFSEAENTIKTNSTSEDLNRELVPDQYSAPASDNNKSRLQ